MTLTPDQIHLLVAARLQAVLALDAPPAAEATFAHDLHADSLDLLEVVEAVEVELAGMGLTVNVPEDRLLTVTSVGDAVRTIIEAMSEQPA